MPHKSKAIANHFLDLAESCGQSLSPMKVQKLVYFAHGWELALTGKPLIDEHVQAWSYGPVIRSLYNCFREFGSNGITEKATDVVRVGPRSFEFQMVTPSVDDAHDENPKVTKALLKRIWDVYGGFTAVQLSNLTHAPGTPWDQLNRKYSGNIPKYATIPDEIIAEYFRKEAERHERSRVA